MKKISKNTELPKKKNEEIQMLNVEFLIMDVLTKSELLTMKFQDLKTYYQYCLNEKNELLGSILTGKSLQKREYIKLEKTIKNNMPKIGFDKKISNFDYGKTTKTKFNSQIQIIKQNNMDNLKNWIINHPKDGITKDYDEMENILCENIKGLSLHDFDDSKKRKTEAKNNEEEKHPKKSKKSSNKTEKTKISQKKRKYDESEEKSDDVPPKKPKLNPQNSEQVTSIGSNNVKPKNKNFEQITTPIQKNPLPKNKKSKFHCTNSISIVPSPNQVSISEVNEFVPIIRTRSQVKIKGGI